MLRPSLTHDEQVGNGYLQRNSGVCFLNSARILSRSRLTFYLVLLQSLSVHVTEYRQKITPKNNIFRPHAVDKQQAICHRIQNYINET